ncbi:hypothetical protein [Chryseobacterium taeanense]|uniref:hypothetical protein n=1 Tax=Chryseobacterium taeanense TaxID=311334 RepID=UPI0035AE2FCE
MKKFLEKKVTLLFSAGALLLSVQFLKAEETDRRPQQCHCWSFLGIVEHCNKACGDGDLSNGEATQGSGWTWFP